MKNITNNDNSSKAVLYRFLCVSIISITKTQFEMCVELEINVLGS